MGYYYTAEPENAVPPKSWATPKTHVPGSPVKERGLRYYMPETGRWVSRDPSGEASGPNVFAFINNEPIGTFDLLGLWIHVGLPRTTAKCNLVGTLMALYSQAGTLNYMLWMHWLSGGGDVNLSYGWFDPLNVCRNFARDEVRNQKSGAESAASGQSCGTMSLWKKDIFKASCWSPHLMINKWIQTTTYTIHVGKECNNNCCKRLVAEARWTNKAFDRTDFNPGDVFILPPFEIEDELVNQCFSHQDFNVTSTHNDEEKWTFPCH